MDYSNLKPLDIDAFKSKNSKTLYRSICVPSATQSYSLCVEFMKKWFLTKFPPDTFKSIYTDGKNSCEAYMYAKGLLEVYFSYALKYEIEYNKPTDLEKFLPQCKDNELVMFVDAIVETKE